MSQPRPGSGRSAYRNLYRNEFRCYSNRRCNRPAHMRYRSLTEPWYIRGTIVDNTVDGTCQDMVYEQHPWTGVCAYLEIHNPGIYTFGTPCDCGSEVEVAADLNERLCIWQGERCGGNIVRQAFSPPPPGGGGGGGGGGAGDGTAADESGGGWYPPINSTSSGNGLDGGAVTGIVVGSVGCAAIMAACAYYAYARAARTARAASRVPRLATGVALRPMLNL